MYPKLVIIFTVPNNCCFMAHTNKVSQSLILVWLGVVVVYQM